MSLRTRQELLASVRDRYAQANRREKGRILDELTAATEQPGDGGQKVEKK